jgi:integrin beta 3
MSKLIPKYTPWEAINAALAVGMRALEEIRTLARTPGPAGKDGKDGLGFDDMEEHVEDEGRTIVRTYKRGDQVKQFRHKTSVLIYREVFKEGQTYQRGDAATYGGSTWHCNLDDTTLKPGAVGSEKAWTLMTKRGRDGKDGTMKPPTKPGPVKVG